MHVIYKVPTYEYMIESIVEFQGDDQGEFFRESLYYFYSIIDRKKVEKMNGEKQNEYISESLKQVYEENYQSILEKKDAYQKHWNLNEEIIRETFEEIFEVDLGDIFLDIEGNISLNPICPRYLDKNSFDVFYLNSEKGALGMTLHELVHFVWFYKWKGIFNDSVEEYDTPHLKWVFSEIVVDAILSDERLKALNPYETSIYAYFHEIEIEGKKLVDIIEKMYNENSIEEFMKKGYDLCLQYEDIIRKVM